MADDREARRERARVRSQQLVGRLVSREEDVPPVGGTPAERLEMLAEASERAWALSGQVVPTWQREAIPGRVLRRA